MILDLDHVVFESERIITREIYIQHVTFKEGQNWLKRGLLIGMVWLCHTGIVTLCDLLIFEPKIPSSQPKCVLQKCQESYCSFS